MKIIGKSNCDDESVSDILVCDNVYEFGGRYIVDFLNCSYRKDPIYCYELVSDDYKLYSFKP